MILLLLHNLEEETKEAIRKAQQQLQSNGCNVQEYEDKYEALMDNYRLMTQIILEKR